MSISDLPNHEDPFDAFTSERLRTLVIAIISAIAEFQVFAGSTASYKYMHRLEISKAVRLFLTSNIRKSFENMDGIKIRDKNNGFFITLDEIIVVHVKRIEDSEQLVNIPKTLANSPVVYPQDIPIPGLEDYIPEEPRLSDMYDLVMKYATDESNIITAFYICDQEGDVIVKQIEIPLTQTSVLFEAEPDFDVTGITFEMDNEDSDNADSENNDEKAEGGGASA